LLVRGFIPADEPLALAESGVGKLQGESARDWCGRSEASHGRADCPCGAPGAAPLSTPGGVGRDESQMREGSSPFGAKTPRPRFTCGAASWGRSPAAE